MGEGDSVDQGGKSREGRCRSSTSKRRGSYRGERPGNPTLNSAEIINKINVLQSK